MKVNPYLCIRLKTLNTNIYPKLECSMVKMSKDMRKWNFCRNKIVENTKCNCVISTFKMFF